MRSVRRFEWASEQQAELFRCGPDPTLMLGGFNAAKTWGAVLKLLYLLGLFPNSRAAVIRSSAKHMRHTTMETFYSLCPPSAYEFGRRSDQDGICELNNRSMVRFIHLDKPESLQILAGLELNFGMIDQAEQIEENAWDTLDARLARWGQAEIPQWLIDMEPGGIWPWTNDAGVMTPPPFLFATANPPESEDHFLFRRFADESDERARWKELGYRLIVADSRTNKFASKANIRKMLGKDEEFVKRYVEGRWASPQGSIFEIHPMSLLEWSPELMTMILSRMNLHRSMDHGDSNPTCVLWEGSDHDGNIFVYREYYEPDRLVSDHRRTVWEWSQQDVQLNSLWSTPQYRSNIADPSIFGVSRGRTATSAPTWSIADEWLDTRVMDRETIVAWSAAPIPKSENNLSYELTTRSRIKEYLKFDPKHRHPLTGEMGSPRIFFIKKSADYPQGCHHVIKELRGQRRIKIGEREGKPIFSEERDPDCVDHAYDTLKYHVISRPSPSRIIKTVDPNSIDIQELMQWTARRQRARVAKRGGY